MTSKSLGMDQIMSRGADGPELPTMITMPDGKEYSVAGDVWTLPEHSGLAANVRFNWKLLAGVVVEGDSKPVMSARAVRLVQLYVLERMSAVRFPLKPCSGKCILNDMLHLARWLATHPQRLPNDRSFDWCDLTGEIFEAWVKDEYRRKRKGNSAMRVRRFYFWGVDLDTSLPDFSMTVAACLDDLTLKKSDSGELAESRDCERGPFTREELTLIYKACKSGAGTDHDRAIVWTFLETAMRPRQLYGLTNLDLETNTSDECHSGGTTTNVSYRLRIRKIKLQGDDNIYHYSPLSEGCGRLLSNLRKPGSGPEDPLLWWISSSWFREYIQRRLRIFFDDADLRSPRLKVKNPEPGGPIYHRMPVTPRRFRYGFATDRIDRGESPDDVAAALGHEDPDTVSVYAKTSPRIADEFRRATDYVILPLIDLMEGRVNPSDVESLRDADPAVLPELTPQTEAPVFMRGKGSNIYNHTNRQSRAVELTVTSTSSKSADRIEELVSYARRKFPSIYPNQDFDSQFWHVAHLRERPNANDVVEFGFTTLASNTGNKIRLSRRPEDALPPYFAEVIKSWLVASDQVSLTYNRERLLAARHFWNFLSTDLSDRATSFDWAALCENDLLAFEQFLLTYKAGGSRPLNPNGILAIIDKIQRLADFLAGRGICRHFDYIPQTQPVRPAAMNLDEKRQAAERKLPNPGVLESLACIYHRLTTAAAGEVSDWMLIAISAVAILMLTGLRIGELVTLPFNCEVEEKHPTTQPGEQSSCYYGIKYWVEKTKRKKMRIKWISPTAEPIVRSAIARIKRLTAAARERARVLEADPTKVPLPPEVSSRTTLTRAEVLALLGRKENVPVSDDPQTLLPEYGERYNRYYYVQDLEAYLLSKRVPQLYTIRHDDGSIQMLSESLFVIFAKQLRYPVTGPCYLLVEPVKAGMIKSSLCGQPTLFKLYGNSEREQGLLANTHCFRHWLIHVAYKGGMETRLLLRYFAKRYASSLTDYLHFSTEESEPYAPEELSGGQFYVPV